MLNQHRQRGITITGFIFVAIVVLGIAMIGFRVLPSYIEYYAVEKTMKKTLNDARDGISLGEFRRSFDLASSADYIESVHGADIDLSKEGNQITATAAWQKKLPLVANISLLLDFEASASK